VLLYYAIACGWAWLAWSPVVFGSNGLKLIHLNASIAVFTCVATLGPFFGCFITHRMESGDWRAVRLLPQSFLRWLWVFLGPLLILATYFVVFPALISKGSPAHWQWRPAVLTSLWIPMFNYNLFGGPLFEEFGWRGFLQARLQQVMPPWIGAICVGVMWGAWHAPLFLVTWSSASPLIYILIVVTISPLFAYAFNASGGAVAVAILMHSAFNSSSRFLDPFLRDTPIHEHPPGELFIAFAFLAVSAFVAFFTRGRLNAQSEARN
jgi:membrane protease YdiL (CAAX protease family)